MKQDVFPTYAMHVGSHISLMHVGNYRLQTFCCCVNVYRSHIKLMVYKKGRLLITVQSEPSFHLLQHCLWEF